jgi:Mg2+ transporter MgtE
MRLKVPSDKLSVLHPADLAEILSDLNRQEGSKLLQSLDDETLADTLEEVEPEFQASLVEQLSNERIADVLEEMSPDEAADLLAELPEDRSAELLNLMEKDEAEDVRKLLTFPVESAGGIMTTEFVTLPADLTANQAIARIRETANDSEIIYYIYVTDEENHLSGVFSLRQLVLSNPKSHIKDFMETRVISVKLDDDQDHCAHLISKYNLLAIPVIDELNVLHGIVTADDALDKIIPTAWKKRLPKLYH